MTNKEIENIKLRIDGVHTRIDDVHKRVDDLYTSLDVQFQALNVKIESKFEGHNDYHLNQEARYKTWFKIIVGTCILTSGLIASGFAIEGIQKLFPLFLQLF